MVLNLQEALEANSIGCNGCHVRRRGETDVGWINSITYRGWVGGEVEFIVIRYEWGSKEVRDKYLDQYELLDEHLLSNNPAPIID